MPTDDPPGGLCGMVLRADWLVNSWLRKLVAGDAPHPPRPCGERGRLDGDVPIALVELGDGHPQAMGPTSTGAHETFQPLAGIVENGAVAIRAVREQVATLADPAFGAFDMSTPLAEINDRCAILADAARTVRVHRR